MDFFQNITFRRTRTHSDSILNKTDELLTDTINDDSDNNESLSSLPDLSKEHQQEELTVLKLQLQKLENELRSAHQEIECLSLENTKLREHNLELTKKNDLYKTVTYGPVKSTKTTTPNKKRKPSNKQTQTETCSTNLAKLSTAEQTSKEINKQQACTNDKNQKTKNKICILSSNNRNNITQTAENTFEAAYDLCHYLLPNTNTERMLCNINTKLKDFTINDFCIILIGENDFRTTTAYFDLIFYIRSTLSEIKHTNVIICAPTYKYGRNNNIYNSRIENFNNLLYLDILAHEHAYFLDSNKNLSCDFKMFDKLTGRLNNYGMSIIFTDIINYINDIIKFDIQNDILMNVNNINNSMHDNLTNNELFLV